MDTYYAANLHDEEEHFLRLRAGKMDIDANKAFLATLVLSLVTIAYLRLTSYVNLF